MKKKTSFEQVRLPIPPRAKKEFTRLVEEDAEMVQQRTVEHQNKQFRAQAKKMQALLVPLKKITGTSRKKQR